MSLFNAEDMRKVAQKDFGGLAEVRTKESLNKIAGKSMEDKFDIFMSHRALDSEVVYGVTKTIEGLGYTVYVDSIVDHELDRTKVNKETASLLKVRMDHCRCLFFATSENSGKSVWMPWELGYFDGRKDGKVAILPVSESRMAVSTYAGQEYLALYYYIDIQDADNDGPALWVNETSSTYVIFDRWLRGKEPYEHHRS